MATPYIKSIRVALESTFARIAAATGLPSAAGASYAPLEFERASVDLSGFAHESSERADGRASAYNMPPEPVTMFSGASRVRRWTGSLSVSFEVRTIGAGTAYGTYAAMPAYRLLASGMGSHTPTTTSDAVSAASATANNTRWTPTAIASFPETDIGAGVAVDIAGRKEFSFITDRIDAGTDLVYVSPGFTTDLTNASSHLVYLCQTLYAALGVTTPLGEPVTCAIDGDGWQAICYGGRLASATFRPDGRKIMCDAVVQFAVIQTDHASYAVSDPTRASGAIAHSLGSYLVITGAIGTTSPAELGGGGTPSSILYSADDWSFTWTNTLAKRSWSNDLAGCSDYEVVDVNVAASITLSVPSSTFDPYFLDQTEFSVLIGCGPTGAGNGCAFYIPAAHLTADAAQRDLGGDLVRQVLNVRQGKWALDDSSTAPARTHARIAFTRQT